MKCPFETRSLFRGHSFISEGGVPNISAESFPLSVKNGVQLFSVILCQKDSAGSIGQQHQLYLPPTSPGKGQASSDSGLGGSFTINQGISNWKNIRKFPMCWWSILFFEDSLPIFFSCTTKYSPQKLTWNLEMSPKRNLLFQGFIFGFHVGFWVKYWTCEHGKTRHLPDLPAACSAKTW